MGMGWRVSALRVASHGLLKSQMYYGYRRYREPDATVDLTFFFWLLQDSDTAIVVDTTFAVDWFTRRGGELRWEISPPDALALAGVDAARIETIVLTHLHFDHIGAVAQFPAAEFVVQRREWEFWHGALGSSPPMRAHADEDALRFLEDAMAHGRVRLADDGTMLAPGVELVLLPGHTPGQQGVIVDGRLVLAADAAHFYDELDRRMLFGTFVDAGAMHESYLRLGALRDHGCTVVPGHDPAVLDRFAPIQPGRPRLGVRLDRPG